MPELVPRGTDSLTQAGTTIRLTAIRCAQSRGKTNQTCLSLDPDMIRRRVLKPGIEVQFRSGLHSCLHYLNHLNLNADGEQVIQLSFSHFSSFIVKPTETR